MFYIKNLSLQDTATVATNFERTFLLDETSVPIKIFYQN